MPFITNINTNIHRCSHSKTRITEVNIEDNLTKSKTTELNFERNDNTTMLITEINIQRNPLLGRAQLKLMFNAMIILQ